MLEAGAGAAAAAGHCIAPRNGVGAAVGVAAPDAILTNSLVPPLIGKVILSVKTTKGLAWFGLSAEVPGEDTRLRRWWLA